MTDEPDRLEEPAPPPQPPAAPPPLGAQKQAGPPPPAPPPPPPQQIDADQIRQAFSCLVEPGGVREIRVLGATEGGSTRSITLRGYFDGAENVIKTLQQIRDYTGVYSTLNPPVNGLEARCSNRLEGGQATNDREIERRLELLVDVDPVRPSGISASEEEHQAAIGRAQTVRAFLASEECGWPQPILIDSGNGAHLRYAVDIPAEDDALVELTLKALHALFSDAKVTIDTSVSNPARIARLPGTMARKGDNLPDRPHRLARILEAPEEREVVTEERLRHLVQVAGVDEHQAATGHPQEPRTGVQPTRSGDHVFDVRAFLDRNPIDVARESAWVGGTKWVLARCPMDDSHEVDKSAWIAQLPSGAVCAGCHHDRCSWGWRELREKYEPRTTRSTSAGPSTNSAPARPPNFEVGSWVRADDRDNLGQIVRLDPGSGLALVHFVSPEGNEADVKLPLAQLSIAGGDDSDSLPPRPIRVYTLEELESLPSQPWILPGVLRRREFAVLYGQPGGAKTFLAIDLACHLTAGIRWHVGKAPHRPMRVLYISAEGGHEDILRRVCAWLSGTGHGPSISLINANLRVVPEAVQITRGGDLEGLQLAGAKAFAGGKAPDLIVFDTLARCAVDVEENSSKEMGKLIARVDSLREASDAAIVLVHHEGKDTSGRERGSSALRGAADLMVRVSKSQKDTAQDEVHLGDDYVVVRCDKAKRQRPFKSFSLALRPERFEWPGHDGFWDRDGERIESAFLTTPEPDETGKAMFDEPEEERVCLAIVDVLRNNFKPDEQPSTSELLVAFRSKRIPKNKLYEHRSYGQKQGLFDWKKDGRSIRWSLGPAALKSSASDQPELFSQRPSPGLCDDPSNLS